MRILFLNGPNLGRLGQRNPQMYGTETLREVAQRAKAHAEARGATLIDFQSNHEGELIDRLEDLDFDAVVINPGAYGHTSYALRDAIESIDKPTIEVHISNVHAREAFRQVLVLEDVVSGQVIGRGTDGYLEAIDLLLDGKKSTRTAIVTGAASGIGRATAERLIRDDWTVVGIDMKASMPNGVTPVVGDAADSTIIEAALAKCNGSLDGLVCAAGLPPNASWDDEWAWHELLRVDLTSSYRAVLAAMPALSDAHGSVVFVGSIVGPVEGSLRSPGYAAAKSGLEGLARSLALVGAPGAVRVNVVEPGAIDTPLDPPRFPVNDRPDVPLGRMGTADEVAAAICFLLSDDASYVTGAVLRVDGGRSILPPGAAIRS